MAKKWIKRVSVVGVAGIFATVSLVFALDNGPDKLTINAQKTNPDVISKKDKKKVKDFDHKKHQGEYVKGKQGNSLFKYTDDWTCGACHHTDKKGEQPGQCLKCKENDKMFAKAKAKGGKKFEKIYHVLCRDACHKKNDKETGKKTAKCKACHKKKKK